MADALSMLEQLIEVLFGSAGMGDPDGESFLDWLPVMVPGTVAKRSDPEGRGRIIARVPALFEQGTPWLEPFVPGGGSPQRGTFAPPLVGAPVGIFFPLGRVHAGYYLPMGWRKKSEIPTGGVVDKDRTAVAQEDAQWLFLRDDRDGSGAWSIKHKATGAYISIQETNEIIFNSAVGKLGESATEAIVRGDKLASYLGNGVSIGSLINYLEKIRTAVNALAPGALPDPVPAPPSDLLSTKWKVE